MYIRKVLVSICVVNTIICLQGFSAEPDLWLDFKLAQKSGKEPILPDFSWAGYHYSEKKIPKVRRRVFKVTRYGAKPNDNKYDDKAVQKAIDAAEAKGGGIVLFPPGRFKFCPKKGLQSGIQINSSNIVLRGAGSGKGGTELFIDKMNIKNGSSYFLVAPLKRSSKLLATIKAPAKRETRELTVDNASLLKRGQTIMITNQSKGFIKPYFSPKIPSKKWTRLFKNGLGIQELHIIERIKGKRVLLREPIHLTIMPQKDKNFEIRSVTMIEEVGIEHLRFTGNWNDTNRDIWIKGKPRKFVHHRKGDPIDDYAWEALTLQGVRNSWIRDCEFKDLNTCIYIRSSAAVTVQNTKLTGKRGHTSIHVRRSYGVLIKDCVDTANHHHGPGLGYSSVGTVYLRHKMNPGQCIDCHSGAPYATLMDSVKGGHFDGNGGPYENFPHHGKWFVAWNFEQRGGRNSYNFWPGDKRNGHTFCLPIFVGLHGTKVKMKNALYNIKPGKKVKPASLFEAQLDLRLRKKKRR